jgi:hypothetical protein
LPTYLRLRQVNLSLNRKLVGTLTKETIEEGGRRLGILRRGVLVLDTEDVVSVLMDYCIHYVFCDGRSAAQRMMVESPPPVGSDEMTLLQAMIDGWYSLFQVLDREPGVGVVVRDVLRGDTDFLTDVGLSASARQGCVVASRMISLDGFLMSTGAAMPVPKTAMKAITAGLKRMSLDGDLPLVSPVEEAELAAMVIRTCLQAGAAEHVRFQAPEEQVSRVKQWRQEKARALAPSIRANKNSACPCGSGRKYRSCCGKR